MLPRLISLGCRLAPLGAVITGCSLLWPEPVSIESRPDRPVTPIVTSDAIPPQLPIIFFSAGGDQLDIGAREKIEVVASVAMEPPWTDRPILVRGHSDAQGRPEFNRTLSLRRAELVADELIFAGVPRDRIIVEAAGDEEPLAPNVHADGSDNPEGRALNRRVEIRLLVLPADND